MDAAEPLRRFLGEVGALGPAARPAARAAAAFPSGTTTALADLFFHGPPPAIFDGGVACEPRHATWFTDAADVCLSRVPHPPRGGCRPGGGARGAAVPGGWRGFTYRRLHGSPEIYRSAYAAAALNAVAREMQEDDPEALERWCILDNTALGEAAHDALALLGRL